MSRPNLDPVMAAALDDGVIAPVMLAELTFNSGIERVWSGVGDLVWDSKTWSGVGLLGSVGAITEASAVQAEGTTVTLSGIGLSQIPVAPLGITPPDPPVTVPDGQTVAWAYPRVGGPDFLRFGNGSTGLLSPTTGGASAWPASKGISAAGSAFFTVSRGLGTTSITMSWSDFIIDVGIPLDAAIQAIYPVIVAAVNEDLASHTLDYSAASGSASFPGVPSGGFAATQFSGPSIGVSLSALPGAAITANLSTSLYGNAVTDTLSVSNVAFAVYYTSASAVIPPATLLYEALNDIRLGAPAKIWFGLLSEGTFLGAPYLIFKGAIDKPTSTTSPQSSSISLALENRLVNLQRPSNRKYTSADQRLYFPDDLFFSWVEILQDISLKEGQS